MDSNSSGQYPAFDASLQSDRPIMPTAQPFAPIAGTQDAFIGMNPYGTPGDQPKPKHSGGKTGLIIGGLFLLIVLPVVGFYVAQKTNIMNNLPFAEKEGRPAQSLAGNATTGTPHASGPSSPPLNAVGVGGANPTSCPPGQTLQCYGGANANSEGRTCSCVGSAYTPTPTQTLTPSPSLSPTSTLNPTQSSGAKSCDASCSADSECGSGLSCVTVDGSKKCRKSACASESSCSCPENSSTTDPGVGGSGTGGDAVGSEIPVTGVPSVLGAATIAGGVLLLLLGLAL